MFVVLIALVNASLFSIDGIGEDMSAFRLPFSTVDHKTQIEFFWKPEFTILNKGSDFRSIFWTQPFSFRFASPIAHGLSVGVGYRDKFIQSFDAFLDEEPLIIHLQGAGGIEETYAQCAYDFGFCEIAGTGSYLFGNALEVWDYEMAGYTTTDSLLYKYQGKTFSAGIRWSWISLAYEFLGDIDMEKETHDTTIDLPQRLSVGFSPQAGGGQCNFVVEHSFWHDDRYRSPTRIKIGYSRERLEMSYRFSPWYLSEITEHGVNIGIRVPVQGLGTMTLGIDAALKTKHSLREFSISPQILLTLEELFARRK